MPQPNQPPLNLEKHVHATYFMLRVGMAAIALSFPLVLWWGGAAWAGIERPLSMSAYYHPGPNGHSMRDWFVGILFVIGACLYLYKGYSRRENFVLNLAGLMAVGIAVIPMASGCGGQCSGTSVHGTLSLLFFICIGYVCLFCADETLQLLADEKLRQRYRWKYRACALVMVAFPLAAVGLNLLSPHVPGKEPIVPLFFIEASGVIAFASYWFFKSRELARSQADKKALKGEWPL